MSSSPLGCDFVTSRITQSKQQYVGLKAASFCVMLIKQNKLSNKQNSLTEGKFGLKDI